MRKLYVLLVLSGLVLGGAGFVVAPSTQVDWMVPGSYFAFSLTTSGPDIFRVDYFRVRVIAADSGTVTLEETYRYSYPKIVLTNVYDKATRRTAEGAYAWFWVTKADILDKQVWLGDFLATVERRSATWELRYTGPEGTADYRYEKETGLLTIGRFETPDATVYLGRVYTSIMTSSAVAAPEPTVLPPYDSSWTGSYLIGYGVHSKWAKASADHMTGKAYTESAAYAGPGFGIARADAYAQFADSFRVPATGWRKIETWIRTILSEISGAWVCKAPWGCAGSDGWVIYRFDVFDSAAGHWVGGVEVVVQDAPNHLLGWYWPVSQRLDILSTTLYFVAETNYWIRISITVKNAAAAFGIIALAYSRASASVDVKWWWYYV